jgi:hypothetical protein
MNNMEMFIGRPDDSGPCNLGDIINRVHGINLITPESPVDDLLDLYNCYKYLYEQFGDLTYKHRMGKAKEMFLKRNVPV